MLAVLATLLLAPPPAPQAPDTLVGIRSSLSVVEAIARLRTAAETRGLTIFAVVDHGVLEALRRAAAGAGGEDR